MLPLTLDRTSGLPAYRQIYEGVVRLVEEEVLRPGDRLPPSRALAGDLDVHRSTVVRAYEELHALGYLESRAGSYTTVRQRERLPTTSPAEQETSGTTLIDWGRATGKNARDLRGYSSMEPALTSGSTNDTIDFDRLSADPALAPDADLRRCLKRTLIRVGSAALDYTESAGWAPLRELLATRMAKHGVACRSDEILVTSGAQHALDTVLRLLTVPGDRVAVEAPTYGMMHSLLRLHGLEAVEVPLLPTGMDLEHLERALGGPRPPKLVYTMPSFHNPTGITTDQEHRERLLLLCERHRVPVVEDGFEEEMKYTGKAVLPVKSMDTKGIVLYVGTFSKVVFPGLRVGWIAGPREAVGRMSDIVRTSSISGNTLAQAAVARFCVGGGFEAYLRRIYRVYRRRMDALMSGLEDHMPPEVHWARPRGGYTTWLTLPADGPPEETVVARAAAVGVRVGAGHRYYGMAPAEPHLRLSIACVDEERIRAGCRRLGEALRGSTPGL